jgi:hypothetical protein
MELKPGTYELCQALNLSLPMEWGQIVPRGTKPVSNYLPK